MTAARSVLAHVRTRRGEKTSDVKLVVDRVDGNPDDRLTFKIRAKAIDAAGNGGSAAFVKLTAIEAITVASAIYRELGLAQRESP